MSDLGTAQPPVVNTNDPQRYGTPPAAGVESQRYGTPTAPGAATTANPAGNRYVAPQQDVSDPTYRPDSEDTFNGNKHDAPLSTTVGPRIALSAERRNHVIAAFGEFVGTFIFLWCGYMIAQVANQYDALQSESGSQPAQLLMIAFGFGFGFFIAFLAVNKFSGGNLNPAVTLTLLLARKVSPIRGLIMWLAQMIASMAAAGAATAMTPGPLTFANRLGGECSKSRGLFIEAFCTALLCIIVLFLAIEKNAGDFLTGLGIAFALFIGHLASVYYTGAGINPARAFGPEIAGRSFAGYHWLYWVGPIIGSFIAFGTWKLCKFMDTGEFSLKGDEEAQVQATVH